MSHHIDLDTIVLGRGSHSTREQGVCLLEAVAWWAHEPHSDSPSCVCPTLAAFGRSWNDGMRSDEERDQLRPYVPVLVGTAGSDEDAARRAWMALDWSVRVSTPAWLDLAGLADHGERLRGLPAITGPADEVMEALTDARRAGDAARAAARAAVRDAAGDAAEAAARDAAEDAARAALAPTVAELQGSAHLLLRQMIAAGPHDADAFAGLPSGEDTDNE